MHEALKLLTALEPGQLDWMLSAGHEERRAVGEALIVEGRVPADLYIVLDGVFELRFGRSGNRAAAYVGPGELVGEVSFLSGEAASASLVASEAARVLVLPRTLLAMRIESDPRFAALFYRVLAQITVRRMLERQSLDGRGLMVHGADAPAASIRRELEEGLTGFKKLMTEAYAEAIRNGEGLTAATARRVHEATLKMMHELNRLIGDQTPLLPDQRAELGQLAQRELLPHLTLSQNAERFYSKPRGYAGDFQTIELIYENRPAGTGRLGTVLDGAILDAPTSHAVRNRRALLATEIRRELDAHGDRAVHVASLACGPARELFDVYEQLSNKTRLVSTLIDIDFQALAFVSDRSERAGLKKQMRLRQNNLVYLALGREQISLEPQDFVYSIGLIDYFEDKVVIQLLEFIHRLLRPGGRALLGNFHPRSPMKAVMDHVLEWRLIYRDEDDMNKLFAASAFARPCTRIQTEAQGINLFAECVRES